MDILFYPGYYTPLEEPMRGTVVEESDGHYIIASELGEYRIPIGQTRRPWEPQFYEFYKAPGYYADLWRFHAPVLGMFFIFIY